MKKKLPPSGPDRSEDLEVFYKALDRLRRKQGVITFSKLKEAASRLSKPGVYFIFDPNEKRRRNPSQLRCVRVGEGSRLWSRLQEHCSNHYASVFRHHVGAAMLKRRGLSELLASWKRKDRGARDEERPWEKAVSDYIGKMQILWVEVQDKPGPETLRSFIEEKSVGLLAWPAGRLDLPSRNWLGRDSISDKVSESGLWNVHYLRSAYDPSFLEKFRECVDKTLG